MSRMASKLYMCIWAALCGAGLAAGLGRMGWAAVLLGLTAVMLLCFCLFAEKLDRLAPDEDGMRFSPSLRRQAGMRNRRISAAHSAASGLAAAQDEGAPALDGEATRGGASAGRGWMRRFRRRPSDHLDVQAAQALTEAQEGATHGPAQAEESVGEANEAA